MFWSGINGGQKQDEWTPAVLPALHWSSTESRTTCPCSCGLNSGLHTGFPCFSLQLSSVCFLLSVTTLKCLPVDACHFCQILLRTYMCDCTLRPQHLCSLLWLPLWPTHCNPYMLMLLLCQSILLILLLQHMVWAKLQKKVWHTENKEQDKLAVVFDSLENRLGWARHTCKWDLNCFPTVCLR